MNSSEERLNQPPPLIDYSLFSSDRVLRQAVAREGAAWACRQLEEYGRQVGSAAVMQWGVLANEYPPVLRTHDRYGQRRDEVEFHPAWHELMRLAVDRGHPQPAVGESASRGTRGARGAGDARVAERSGPHVPDLDDLFRRARAASRRAYLAREWIPRILSTTTIRPSGPATEKQGVLVGMGMTEKQGGSDVRANTTRAEPIGNREYLLDGHKWFCSAPMCDAFLVLAQAPRGLSCFLLPRWTSRWRAQRLPPAAAQAEAGQSLQRLERSGISRRLGAPDRRRRPRRRHHHRDGAAHAPRLRDCVGGADAARAGRGDASCAPPPRLRTGADRSAR